MYRFYINDIDNEYHYSELIRTFIDNDEFEVIPVNLSEDYFNGIVLKEGSFFINSSEKNISYRRDDLKKELYLLLTKLTGYIKPWGTVTGVHPLKLAYKAKKEHDSYKDIESYLNNRYFISDKKLRLLSDIMRYQDNHVNYANSALPYNDIKTISLYIGIPFCPTVCNYCSFVSSTSDTKTIHAYLDYLIKEIEYTGNLALNLGYRVESVYIGGGTPTILDIFDLRSLLNTIIKSFNIDTRNTEITLEAGRPDTITKEKLSLIKEFDIERISINPQSLNQQTLKNIGRYHTVEDFYEVVNDANSKDIDIINSDIIAGLRGETLEDFKHTLDKLIELNIDNITVHTLSVKKGSILKDESPNIYKYGEKTVESMLNYSYEKLKDSGYFPYYIYKQKNQIGGMENTGWCKLNRHSIYNIRIIEENQSIIALGAGGVGKRYYPYGNNKGLKIKRIANPKNFQIYINNFDEILERKRMYF